MKILKGNVQKTFEVRGGQVWLDPWGNFLLIIENDDGFAIAYSDGSISSFGDLKWIQDYLADIKASYLQGEITVAND